MATRTTVAAASLMSAAALMLAPWAATAMGRDPGPATWSHVAAAVPAHDDDLLDESPLDGTMTAPAGLNVVPSTAGATEVVSVTVGAVVLGQDDGLPAVLTAGGTYTARVLVLAAERGPRARASMLGEGARVTGCRQVRLTAGAVAQLNCQVRVTARTGRVALVVVARGGAGTRAWASYPHQVGT